MANAELGQGAADLGCAPSSRTARQLRSMEVMGAAVGIEFAKQPVRVEHLGNAAKAREGAFLLDEGSRLDRPHRIIERDHQVVLTIIAG
jgi:hypothetical protein